MKYILDLMKDNSRLECVTYVLLCDSVPPGVTFKMA